MSETVIDPGSIRASRQRMEMTIKGHELRLKRAKKDLENLQEDCPHPNEKNRSEYDFTAHWCNDCGKSWSTRR